MGPTVNNIQEALPVFVQAVLNDDLLTVSFLLEKFPKLIHLKDSKKRNVLMMAIYGKPLFLPSGPAIAQNLSVISYLISSYAIAEEKIDLHHEDEDGLNAYDWAVLSGNEFARRLLVRLGAYKNED